MKVRLMYSDEDFDPKRVLPSNADALVQDLDLNTLLDAMARGDVFVREVAKVAVLSSLDDPAEIAYRQDALRDCLEHISTVVAIYDLAAEAIQSERKFLHGFWKSPESILRRSIEVLEMFVGQLKKLRQIADEESGGFTSDAFSTLFAMLLKELDDSYFERIEEHLRRLRFRDGVLISAQLGTANKSIQYVLRKPKTLRRNWVQHLSGRGQPQSYGFQIADGDEAGFRALEELRDQGINPIANALAQSTDHILSFFTMLRTELAFYIGCLELHRKLDHKGEPICLPVPMRHNERNVSFRGLYDVCLSLKVAHQVIGNDVEARDKSLIVITGANRGGKSTFLRSVGVAQLMMQCGMFVPAEEYRSHTVTQLFTHFRREEDIGMRMGKLDEELSRMSEIADQLRPDGLVLFNESFASTNEREGSEIASQVFDALLDAQVEIVVVTHLYELADRLHREKHDEALFLRAERLSGGQRTFKLVEAEPLPTSYGEDLYARVFGSPQAAAVTTSTELEAAAPSTEGPANR